MRTSELQGAALDWAVSVAHKDVLAPVPYSRQWRFGGPIIEQEQIGVWWAEPVVLSDGEELGGHWYAEDVNGDHVRVGPTPLIAAMRCYVASKLGEEVDIPEELK